MKRKKGLMLLAQIFKIVAPPSCRACDRPGRSVCLPCLRRGLLPYTNRCLKCGWGTPTGEACLSCEQTTSLAGLTAGFRYLGLPRELIVGLKNWPDYYAAQTIGDLLTRRILMTQLVFDVVVPIPTAPQRYRERGYNPAGLIARRIARQLALPYRPRTLLRLTHTHQIGQDRRERLEQISGAFAVRPGARVNGRRVLLVDDVVTTGATLEEAARVLRENGATQVWGAAVARR